LVTRFDVIGPLPDTRVAISALKASANNQETFALLV
jgi:hypothetical protein